MRLIKFSLLFFLTKKVTKKSRRFDAGDSLVRSFPMTNRQVGKSFKWEGLRSKSLLRAITGFLKALYFSLNVSSYLEHTFSEK
jgi:hypothetical protein